AFLRDALLDREDLDGPFAGNAQAWLLYVLTIADDDVPAVHVGALYDARDHLGHYGRALLILTLNYLDPAEPRIDTIISDLENDVILSATGAHWEESTYSWWAMDTDTRSTAIVLDALVAVDPEGDLLPNVVRWLMTARRAGIWETTQETVWALIALTDWMVATGELDADYDLSVDLDGEEILAAHVTPSTAGDPIVSTLPLSSWEDPQAALLTFFRGDGPGRLYYTAHVEAYLPVEEVEPLDRGIIVQRQYVSASCARGESCESLEEAAVGEIVQVRLTIIAPHDLYYVVLEDPLPAGGEAIDPTLATSSLADPGPALYRDSGGRRSWWWSPWWWSWYSHSELRDEKVVLFADYLPSGTYTYEYSFRATQVGNYHVLPATAWEFYFPEVFGRSEGELFEVIEP
ncbi:MAG: alpha-2-macroglobulin, partial [Candidatus Bipolaricaulota bacterium]